MSTVTATIDPARDPLGRPKGGRPRIEDVPLLRGTYIYWLGLHTQFGMSHADIAAQSGQSVRRVKFGLQWARAFGPTKLAERRRRDDEAALDAEPLDDVDD